jgi:hypothetical protein
MPGSHAPFLDDPARVAALIDHHAAGGGLAAPFPRAVG